MATKRMFSLKIVDTDAFAEMPNEAQLLYFRLCLAADDDGFVGNPRRVMRSYGITEDSMKILIAKKFVLVLQREEGAILLVKHWRMHNTIKRDRYTPSPYHDLLKFIYLDENNAYSLNPGEGKRPALECIKTGDNALVPFWNQDGTTDKDRLDKSSLEEERKEENLSFQVSGKDRGVGEEKQTDIDGLDFSTPFPQVYKQPSEEDFEAMREAALKKLEGRA